MDVIPILEQRQRYEERISPEARRLYRFMALFGYGHVINLNPNLYIEVTSNIPHLATGLDFLNPTYHEVSEDESTVGPIYTYSYDIPNSSYLVDQLNIIHQLRCRPYSPVIDKNDSFNIYQWLSPIYLEVFPDQTPRPGLLTIPRSIRQQLSGRRPRSTHSIYSTRALAELLGANWDQARYEQAIAQRQNVARSIPNYVFDIQRQLLAYDRVTLGLGVDTNFYTWFKIETLLELTSQSLANLFRAPTTITYHRPGLYEGRIETDELIGPLNQAGQLMSPGFDQIRTQDLTYDLDNGLLEIKYPLC